jgi:curved DNA-binding protein CbpA
MAALELDFQYGEASASDLWTVIKGKYRRLASKYHPDKNPGDPVAEEKMSRVNDAYAYLEAIK